MSYLQDPRVLFAAERTLLAWNRTSLAFIAFGFLIERAGLLIKALVPEQADASTGGATFWLGLAFIALGAFVAVFSSRQHLVFLKTLSAEEFPPGYRTRWGLGINVIVALLGGCLAVVLYLEKIS